MIPHVLLDHLTERFGCHTVLLYGSRARGDAREGSDYDIAAFRAGAGEVVREARRVGDHDLDAWIYPEDKAEAPDASMLQILGAKILRQKDGLGDRLLRRLEAVFSAGPEALPAWDAELRRTWARRMLERARAGDIEAHFRRHWLLVDLLETYFQLRGRWYLGPKQSFQWLGAHDPETYAAFDEALRPGAPLEAIERLVERVAPAEVAA